MEKIFLFFLLFIRILPENTHTCFTDKQISNTNCFTDIIKFDQKKYRAGHAIVTRNGELFIEYSLDIDSSERLFYGLKKNGRNYFSDNSYIKTVNVGDDEGVRNRYESMNRIARLKNSAEDGKEYILSISTYRTVLELYDIETFNSKVKNSIKYLKHQIFSFQFPVLEAKHNNEYIYFCIFSHDDNYWKDEVEYGTA